MKYIYRCPKCGIEYTVVKKMADATRLEYCFRDECEGEQLRRVFLPLGVTWHDNCRDYDNEGLGKNLILRHHQ